ncbi:hypothetical protein HYALB_00003082 [Hymenoscyphus albidus]|uniref:Jacalin-type lectin domain-containing protein n=1 Tax=Hymenoscyphus albidus TaxID=595503 RepID=A0A9N9QAW7_9HELO|nr:hypothetical protein HYALB_00003082 [Hymenoscyphus albidus]
MFYSRERIVAAAAALATLVGVASAGNCDHGPFSASYLAGKDEGGGNFCDTKWEDGITITGIEVWAAKWHIKGFQFTYSDGTKGNVHGIATADGDRHAGIFWDEGDAITKMQWWKNHDQNGIAKIYVETKSGKKLEKGDGKTRGDPSDIPVGSGILMAVRGANGAWLNNIDFRFMGNVAQSAVVSKIKFDEDINDWNKKKTGLNPKADLIDGWIVNPDYNKTQEYIFAQEIKQETSKELTQSNKNAFGLSVGVTVGGGVEIPFLGKAQAFVTTTASYSYEAMTSKTGSEKGIAGFTITEKGTMGPRSAIYCKSTAVRGEFKSKYMATVTVTMAGGQKFDILQPGSAMSIGWTSSVTACTSFPIEKAPLDAITAAASVEKAPKTSWRRSFLGGRTVRSFVA